MILIIGLDGYDYRWAESLEQAGYSAMPMFAPVPLSWVAWNTIGTGVDASSWGVSHDPKDYIEFARERFPRPPYIWETMADHRQSALIVNWPFVLTPQRLYGVLVCGYPAPKTRFVMPPNRAPEWDWSELDLSAIYGEANEQEKAAMREMPLEEKLKNSVDRQHSLAQRFIAQAQQLQPALGFLGITDCDRLSHHAHAGMVEKGFRDNLLLGLIETVQMVEAALQPECIIIVSDHGLDLEAPLHPGGRENVTHSVHLPDSRAGILALKQEGYGLPTGQVAEQIDLAPMILNRLGIAHELLGVDRSLLKEN